VCSSKKLSGQRLQSKKVATIIHNMPEHRLYKKLQVLYTIIPRAYEPFSRISIANLYFKNCISIMRSLLAAFFAATTFRFIEH
jgi:hypothetical protein